MTIPQSKDAIAYDNGDGTIDVWDWQNGTTREPQVDAGDEPDYQGLTQHFIAVEPVNHLGQVPDNGNGDEDNKEVLAALKEVVENTKRIIANQTTILQNQTRTHELIQVLIDKPTPDINIPPVVFPEYKGSIFGLTVTLRPQNQ